ncbi:hypothetical protein B7463_g10011, partial [Scytalidium lignicola]
MGGGLWVLLGTLKVLYILHGSLEPRGSLRTGTVPPIEKLLKVAWEELHGGDITYRFTGLKVSSGEGKVPSADNQPQSPPASERILTVAGKAWSIGSEGHIGNQQSAISNQQLRHDRIS